MRYTININEKLLAAYILVAALYLAWEQTRARNRQARALEQQTRVMKAESEHYPDPSGLGYPRGHPDASRTVEVEEPGGSEE